MTITEALDALNQQAIAIGDRRQAIRKEIAALEEENEVLINQYELNGNHIRYLRSAHRVINSLEDELSEGSRVEGGQSS